VDSDDATMTRKTRNGERPFGSQGSQWCVHAGVDADEAPGPRTSKRAIERVVEIGIGIGMGDLAESGRVRRSVKGPSGET
jgi:hypothetical protein